MSRAQELIEQVLKMQPKQLHEGTFKGAGWYVVTYKRGTSFATNKLALASEFTILGGPHSKEDAITYADGLRADRRGSSAHARQFDPSGKTVATDPPYIK